MKEHYYIGVDGGGTQTRCLLADPSGRVLGQGLAGSTNRNHHSRDEIRANLRACLSQSLGARPFMENVSTLFLGMCAVSTDADREDVISIVREIPEIRNDQRVIVENDTVIGLTGGLAGRPGLALIAGTGSACLGRNKERETRLCGGWGALADDIGSAPWIGVQAIQAAVQSEDGRIEQTILREIVFDFLKLEHPRQLIDRLHNHDVTRARIGTLAPRVIDASRGGDAVATHILRSAVSGLSRLVAATARPLFGAEPCELIFIGGLALSGPPFQSMLEEQIRKDTPGISIRQPEMSPVQGALMEAFRADRIAWSDELLGNLRRI